MNSVLSRVLADTNLLPEWVTKSFPVIRIILIVFLAVSALALVIIILMQKSSSGGGTNAISGAQESYYAQNKGGNREGRLKKLTITFTILIAVLSIIYFIMEKIYKGY